MDKKNLSVRLNKRGGYCSSVTGHLLLYHSFVYFSFNPFVRDFYHYFVNNYRI